MTWKGQPRTEDVQMPGRWWSRESPVRARPAARNNTSRGTRERLRFFVGPFSLTPYPFFPPQKLSVIISSRVEEATQMAVSAAP